MRAIVFIFILSVVSCATRRRHHFNDWNFDSCELTTKSLGSSSYELKFKLVINPDDLWYIQLRKDNSYSYVHWNGYGSEEGQEMEVGNYKIEQNQLLLHPTSASKPLKSRNYYIFAFDETDHECRGIDCVSTDTLTYCLFQKF